MVNEQGQTAVAWIVRHVADGSFEKPPLYFSKAEADAHAAMFERGFARVVELVEREAQK